MPRGEGERNISGLKPWKPGQSGNPRGRPPDALRSEIKGMTRKEIREFAHFLLNSEMAQVERIANSKEECALLVLMARAISRGVSRGDVRSLDLFLKIAYGDLK